MLPVVFPLSTCSTQLAHKPWTFLSPPGSFFTRNFLVDLLPCSETLATWVWWVALNRGWLYFSGPRSTCDRNKHHHEHIVLQVLCLLSFVWYHSSFKISNNISGAPQLQSRGTTSENKIWDRVFKDHLAHTHFLSSRQIEIILCQTSRCLQDLHLSLVKAWKIKVSFQGGKFFSVVEIYETLHRVGNFPFRDLWASQVNNQILWSVSYPWHSVAKWPHWMNF